MSAALTLAEDDLQMPRRARHLYLAAVDGCLIEHADRDAATNGNVSYKPAPIRTVLFTDGLKRVLQTKKSVSIDGQPMLIVSGRVEFDAMGRTVKQYY